MTSVLFSTAQGAQHLTSLNNNVKMWLAVSINPYQQRKIHLYSTVNKHFFIHNEDQKDPS